MSPLEKIPLSFATIRLAFVYHLISRSLGRHRSPAPKPASQHSAFSAVLVVGLMTVGTIFAISMLQLIFAGVE